MKKQLNLNGINIIDEYEKFKENIIESNPTKLDYHIIETYYERSPYKRFMMSLKEENIEDNLFEEGFNRFFYHIVLNHLHKNIKIIHSIYGSDVDYNLIINNYDLFSAIIINKSQVLGKHTSKWIKENISIKSFINMLRVPYEKIKNDYQKLSELASLFNDTVEMIEQILTKCKTNPEVVPPSTISPLRLQEFHDHIARIHLMATNSNDIYSHVIIPDPIKIENYTIECPKNSLELKLWATKVKNCVASYNSKIINEQSHILFVTVDDSPTYTVEVDYHMEKSLRIKYLEKIYRKEITNQERKNIETILIEAVKEANKEEELQVNTK